MKIEIDGQNIFPNLGTYKTKDGFTVELNSLSIKRTHDPYSLILGLPFEFPNYDEEQFKNIENKCDKDYSTLFSSYQKITVSHPQRGKGECLPRFYMISELICSEPVFPEENEPWTLSGLNLIIFFDGLDFHGITSIIHEHVLNVVWNSTAKNFAL